MKLHRFGPTVVIAMAASLVLAACGDDSPTTPATGADDGGQEQAAGTEGGQTEDAAAELSGDVKASGASSQESAMTAWIAGYQGVSYRKEVTTLGRGGSDTTAVALAAALNADVCEIYTDVDGVYTADPRIVPAARKLDRVTYEEMLELAASGAKVLMLRCVEYARRYGIPVHVRSSYSQLPGTIVAGSMEDLPVEQAIITGVAHDRSEGKITVYGVPDRPGEAAQIFRVLADAEVNIDMIVQNVSSEAKLTDISFTLPIIEGRESQGGVIQVAPDPLSRPQWPEAPPVVALHRGRQTAVALFDPFSVDLDAAAERARAGYSFATAASGWCAGASATTMPSLSSLASASVSR